MKTLELLAASTAIAALLGLPVAALTVSVDSDVSVDVGASAGGVTTAGSADAGVAADATVAADTATATEVTGEVAAEAGAVAAAEFVGDVVMSSDGAKLGVVESATTEAGAETKLVIVLDGSVGTKAEKFALTIDAAAVSDSEILLPWTKAELVSALDSQTMTEVDNG